MLNPSRVLSLALAIGANAAIIPARSEGPKEVLGGPKELLGGPKEILRGPKEVLRGPKEVLGGPWEVLKGPWEVLMIWEKDIESGKQTTTVWDAAKENLYERSCTANVDFGGVNIQVDVNDEAAGVITIDHQKYLVDENLASSVSCSRMYSPKHAVAQCYIKLPGGKAKRSLQARDNSGPIECFKGLADQYPLRTANSVLSTEPEAPPKEVIEEADTQNSTSLEARQQSVCGRVRTESSLVLGHGWPWKYTRHGQVSVS
jgi:hypothetical protein